MKDYTDDYAVASGDGDQANNEIYSMQKMHSCVFSFVPVVARSAVCRCFPTFGGFEANKASEGEHLVQTLPARKHCQPKIISSKKIIASEKTLPAKNHCKQKIIASKKNYCQQKHCLQKNISSKKTLPAKNIASRKSLPANIELSV